MANKNKVLNLGAHDRPIRQFLTGIILCCLIITIIASALAGAQVITIIYRSIVVYLILFVASSIIKRYWVSLYQLKQESSKEQKR